MDAAALRWMYKCALKNGWRVSRTYDLDDLIQDGWMCYIRVKRRYPRANKRHLMSLFQRTFLNHITLLARKKWKTEYLEFTMPEPDEFNKPDPFCEFMTTISELPVVAGEAVKALMTSPGTDKPYRRKANGERGTLNQRLCRITGLDSEKFDLPETIRVALK